MGIAPSWATGMHAKVRHSSITIPIADNTYGYRAKVPIRPVRLIHVT